MLGERTPALDGRTRRHRPYVRGRRSDIVELRITTTAAAAAYNNSAGVRPSVCPSGGGGGHYAQPRAHIISSNNYKPFALFIQKSISTQ